MVTRLLVLVTVSIAALLPVAACGTSTSTDQPPSDDAGDASCTNPNVIPDGGGEPVESPEAGTAKCPSGICNYQAQTGCAVGQACRPQFTATSPDVNPGCEAAGEGKAGATCALGSDCAAGYFCAEKICRKQCCGSDWSACDPGESCIRQLQVRAGGVVIDSGMDLCFPVGNCDPLDSSSCAQDLMCAIVDPTGAVACVPASSAKPGESCAVTGACAAGAFCKVNEKTGVALCRALCRSEGCGEPACAPGQGICVHYNGDPTGVGECTPE